MPYQRFGFTFCKSSGMAIAIRTRLVILSQIKFISISDSPLNAYIPDKGIFTVMMDGRGKLTDESE
jgi:hypothetical protein